MGLPALPATLVSLEINALLAVPPSLIVPIAHQTVPLATLVQQDSTYPQIHALLAPHKLPIARTALRMVQPVTPVLQDFILTLMLVQHVHRIVQHVQVGRYAQRVTLDFTLTVGIVAQLVPIGCRTALPAQTTVHAHPVLPVSTSMG
ncbi:MAG: hypothetical protein QF535_19705 [Anaerolineales bacterium]|nr:hypothetical protein [Anaerolineales bacterium]